MTRLTSGSPRPGEAPPGLPHRLRQRDLLGLVDSQPSQELKDPLVKAPALRELVAPAPLQIVQQLAVLQLLADLGPREAIQHREQLPKVPEQQEANLLVHSQAGYISPQGSI